MGLAEKKANVDRRLDGLIKLFTPVDLDDAIDRAARGSASVVAEFAAVVTAIPNPTESLPLSGQGGSTALEVGAAIEVGVEFFVPPVSIQQFTTVLDANLMQISFGYAAARHRGELLEPIVRVVPAGVFHQWRVAWRRTERWQRESRWTCARELLEGVLRQASVGWREIAAM